MNDTPQHRIHKPAIEQQVELTTRLLITRHKQVDDTAFQRFVKGV